MSETALMVLIPELEALIGAWRRRCTGDGPRGMPPHVTLISPFADSEQVGDRLEQVGRAVASLVPFDCVSRNGTLPEAPIPPS